MPFAMDMAGVSSRKTGVLWAFFCGAILKLHTAEAAVSCQFTSSYCGWTPEPADRWLLSDNIITESGLIPATNSAGASGAALIRSNMSDSAMSATLVSEEISLNTSGALSFWVHLADFYLSFPHTDMGFRTAGYLNVIQSNGTKTMIWSETSGSMTRRFTVTVPAGARFRLEFRLRANFFYSGFMGVMLHSEGIQSRFLSCTFGSGLCAWENSGTNRTHWGLSTTFLSYAAPALSADNQFLIAISKATSGSDTAVLRSPVMYAPDPSELSFFYRCGRASTTATVQLTVSAGTKVKRADLQRFDSWEHVYILANASPNIVFEISAVLPPGCHCSMDEVVWTGDKNGSLLATTTMTTRTTTTEETTTPIPTPEPCQVPDPIVVHCKKGNLTFSDANFDLSDAIQAELYGDNTMKCRYILRDMHKWIVRQPHQIGGESSADTIHVLCNAKTTLTISQEHPELSESVNLIYSTGANTPCRSVFLNFLKALAKLA